MHTAITDGSKDGGNVIRKTVQKLSGALHAQWQINGILKGEMNMIRYEDTDPWYMRHYKGVVCVIWGFMVAGITLAVMLR